MYRMDANTVSRGAAHSALDDVITSSEAANILGVTKVTVNRFVSTGYLPTIRRSTGTGRGGHRFNRGTVVALAEARAEARRVLDYRRPSNA
ncbi:MerR-like helix-turn-helix DNA binding domain protein [Gordonia phage Coeur]|uniref:MerR-like helix-turn-helix DNA binding domain protein n=1 Tax=Gordonia phage Coeur TaxID=2571246 RepID=A0A4Y6EPR8_9CAUD|nr:MerR-like helix-turn-helix DNA binding domain protein [Gordonia phage Coeur]QDF17439.1 MerR-like helix-turn-helix DNA binding domain protein [Gordonia phage Coeur]